MGDFTYKKMGEFYILQKHTFPRFQATFNYKTPLPEFINIDFSDDCRVEDMANALSEMDAYMKALHKTLKKKVTSGHTVWIIHPI